MKMWKEPFGEQAPQHYSWLHCLLASKEQSSVEPGVKICSLEAAC